MLEKLNQWARRLLSKMIPYKNIDRALRIESSMSEEMENELELWSSMYRDKSPWLDDDLGLYSLNIASTICSEISRSVLLEFKSAIIEPGENIKSAETKKNTRASYLNGIYTKKVLPKLRNKIEYGMATGGMIFKPYTNDGELYVDFVSQGDFIPIKHNDDGDIIEIAFADSFTDVDKKYTKVEHHIFDKQKKTVTVKNTAYRSDNKTSTDIGSEISLKSIPQWEMIAPEITINNQTQPLYGYYMVPKANNVDTKSPLGVSVFSRAVSMIERADRIFSGLDWEYTGGQMAIDVDDTALNDGNVDQLKKRLYRQVNRTEDTFVPFTPSLRDGNYIHGLNTYLTRVEDLCEVSRGTLAEVAAQARTATELKILQNRSYATVANNQKAIEDAIINMVNALDSYATVYSLSPLGEYEVDFEWDDSIITDTATQLEQKIILKDNGILGAVEVRAWYTGESIETAQANIDKIKSEETQPMNDIFGTGLEQ